MSGSPKFIVVIGASAGGLNALSELIQHLNKGISNGFRIKAGNIYFCRSGS